MYVPINWWFMSRKKGFGVSYPGNVSYQSSKMTNSCNLINYDS